jgi:ATP-dependent helicase/nuclease subunit B
MAPNLFTIAPDADFIAELVKAVLAGFPLPEGESHPPLHQYTILVPNRRTANAMRRAFVEQADSLLLPRIRPIGDVDELDDTGLDAGVLTPVAQHFALISLVHEWIEAYPHLQLAQTLRHAPSQVQALAQSLAQLVNSLDIEEQSLEALRDSEGLEIAQHQEAVVSLLALLHGRLPALLQERRLIGPQRYRNLLIDQYAKTLESGKASGPVIAAGSTGSIPATRRLLRTIAGLENGAVVLPGLDTSLSDDCWGAVTAQHPQAALKQLLAYLDVSHRDVPLIGPLAGARSWLGSELMRPSETTHEWARLLPQARSKVESAIAGLDFMECRDNEQEAAALAALIRLKLAEGGGNIALVTPDPMMARRVTSALARWNIVPENSAGEPLDAFGAARFMRLLIDLSKEPQSSAALAALLHHPAARFGYTAEVASRLAGLADVTLLRSPLMMLGLEQFPQLVNDLPEAISQGLRLPAQAALPGSTEWTELCAYAMRVHDDLAKLLGPERQPLQQQLQTLLELAETITAAELWSEEPANRLSVLADALSVESHWLPDMTLAETAGLLGDYLRRTPFLPRQATTPGLSIVGVLEARLQNFDCVLLAGLSESVWPGAADSGPWLNRPMRDELHIKQPEASIGQMAHDLVQTMGARHLVLSWSREDAGKPLTPSRWVLRLQTVLQTAGVVAPLANGANWLALAASLERPAENIRISLPAPAPPAAARFKKLSITSVDTLIADPYAIYAADILKLRPLENIGTAASYSLRGTIFHLALSIFFSRHPERPPPDMQAALLDAGGKAFSLLPDASIVRHSWWPRFVRVAEWLTREADFFYAQEAVLFPETVLASELDIAGRKVKLTGRADLIRIGGDGSVAIFDFKTGSAPALRDTSGNFSHQLTLEAAIIEKEGYLGRAGMQADLLAYVTVSGGIPPAVTKPVDNEAVMRSGQHLDGVIRLLTGYMDETQPFLPHANAQSSKPLRYDHLSRYREWSSRGSAT